MDTLALFEAARERIVDDGQGAAGQRERGHARVIEMFDRAIVQAGRSR